jgi:hypothetical protein
MNMLATLAMWILAVVAVAALSAHFLRRAFSRGAAPERLNGQNRLAATPDRSASVTIADPARVPFKPSNSPGLASDDANNALESWRCSRPVAVAVRPRPDAVVTSPPPAAELDEVPQAPASGPIPGYHASPDDVFSESAGKQMPLAEELDPGTPVAVGEDEHRELPASAEENAVAETTVKTFSGAGTDHSTVNADPPTPQILAYGAPADQSNPAINSNSFQANTEQPSPTPQALNAADYMDEPALPDEVAPAIATAASDTGLPEILPQDAPLAPGVQPRRQQAVHHDRRGRKRNQAKALPAQSAVAPSESSPARPSADARLRLELHPIRETVHLSLVLSKPEGYPSGCTIDFNGGTQLHSFDENRYDDIDLMWLPDTLVNEFRFSAPGGFTWIRSARRIHIFAGSATEPGFVSVPAAVHGLEHAIVCRPDDADTVRGIAEAAGSPELKTLAHWEGVPTGWCVLTGYTPHQAAEGIAAGEFSSLDPRYNLEIRFVGGMQLRSNAFAEGHAPRIELPDLPDRVSVTIDGKAASADATGAWQAEGCDRAGIHLIDLAPGPSLSYEIVADPANREGWPRWQPEPVLPGHKEAWTRTSICGASILGIGGEAVLAHEAKPTLIALGSRGHATPFQMRSDVNASIALTPEPPAFLLVASGIRRHQGEVIWLGLEPASAGPIGSRANLLAWANVVRSAASRRLPFRSNGSPDAKAAWQRTARRARDFRRRTA